MVRYRRNFVPGGTYFFTVTLADRTSSALVDHVGALRLAFRITRHERPFAIDAIVILPDHLHAIWTLPPGDSDFSGRWRRIKAHFTHRRTLQRPRVAWGAPWPYRPLAIPLVMLLVDRGDIPAGVASQSGGVAHQSRISLRFIRATSLLPLHHPHMPLRPREVPGVTAPA